MSYVEVTTGPLQPGIPAVTSFTDSLAVATNNANLGVPNNTNWVSLVLNWNTAFASPVGWPNFAWASNLSGGGGTGLQVTVQQIGANPPYFVGMGVLPIPILGSQKFYKAPQKFVQITFNALTTSTNFCGFVNFEDQSGTGIGHSNGEITHDSYLMSFPAGLYRCNAVAHRTTLHADLVATQGDVLRLSMDSSNPAQVSLTVTRNGTALYTVVDNNVNRLNGNAFPVIVMCDGTSTGLLEVKNFSCGLGL